LFFAGQKLILRLDVEGVSLTDGVRVPSGRVQVGTEPGKTYSPHSDVYWMGAKVVGYIDGILECELSGHPGGVNSFFSQDAIEGAVSKLILTGGSILQRLTGGNQPVPSWANSQNQPAKNTQPQSVRNKPVTQPYIPGREREFSGTGAVFKREYRFDFNSMQIMDGYALFRTQLNRAGRYDGAPLEIKVMNNFLQSEYDSIKSYFSTCLKKKWINVQCVIRYMGNGTFAVEAEAPVVMQITAELLGEIKFSYIRRELKVAEADSELVTIDELFDKVKGSGLQPGDLQFIDDLLAIKSPKHAENIKLLSAMHLTDLMKLRIQKKPFAFLFFMSGNRGCFLVLETLDRKDATYLWRLNATEEELRADRSLLRHEFAWVEQEISMISTEKRKPYRKDAHENFFWVRHEYEKEDGFGMWKQRLHQILDGDIEE
jgi:hypothetical protein